MPQFPSDPYEGQVFYDPYSETTYEWNKVIFLSNPLPNEIYTGTRLADKFQRTLSRLTEMQSNDYLQGRHKG